MLDPSRIGPPRERVTDPDAAADWLRRFFAQHTPLVLTGAGVSVASGLPAYRDARGNWQHAQPMQHRLFVESADARARYWFRAAAGWAHFARAQPSPVHTRLATWQTNKQIDLIATQNVDGLHQRAGSASVIDLHGRLDKVVCLDCGDLSERDALQRRLLAANPDTLVTSDAATRPDGDTEQSEVPPDFTVPSCTACGGRLKPHVVFYGDTVPRERVEALESALHRARSLLVIGSSLMVYSGFRVARWAHEAHYPSVLLNEGVTRADPIATVRLAVDAQTLLSEL